MIQLANCISVCLSVGLIPKLANIKAFWGSVKSVECLRINSVVLQVDSLGIGLG